MERESGDSPSCHAPVPALSISMSAERPARSTSCRNTASAVGDRQMFPRQTKQTRTIVFLYHGPIAARRSSLKLCTPNSVTSGKGDSSDTANDPDQTMPGDAVDHRLTGCDGV